MSTLVVTALRVVCLAYLIATPPQDVLVRGPGDVEDAAEGKDIGDLGRSEKRDVHHHSDTNIIIEANHLAEEGSATALVDTDAAEVQKASRSEPPTVAELAKSHEEKAKAAAQASRSEPRNVAKLANPYEIKAEAAAQGMPGAAASTKPNGEPRSPFGAVLEILKKCEKTFHTIAFTGGNYGTPHGIWQGLQHVNARLQTYGKDEIPGSFAEWCRKRDQMGRCAEDGAEEEEQASVKEWCDLTANPQEFTAKAWADIVASRRLEEDALPCSPGELWKAVKEDAKNQRPVAEIDVSSALPCICSKMTTEMVAVWGQESGSDTPVQTFKDSLQQKGCQIDAKMDGDLDWCFKYAAAMAANKDSSSLVNWKNNGAKRCNEWLNGNSGGECKPFRERDYVQFYRKTSESGSCEYDEQAAEGSRFSRLWGSKKAAQASEKHVTKALSFKKGDCVVVNSDFKIDEGLEPSEIALHKSWTGKIVEVVKRDNKVFAYNVSFTKLGDLNPVTIVKGLSDHLQIQSCASFAKAESAVADDELSAERRVSGEAQAESAVADDELSAERRVSGEVQASSALPDDELSAERRVSGDVQATSAVPAAKPPTVAAPVTQATLHPGPPANGAMSGNTGEWINYGAPQKSLVVSPNTDPCCCCCHKYDKNVFGYICQGDQMHGDCAPTKTGVNATAGWHITLAKVEGCAATAIQQACGTHADKCTGVETTSRPEVSDIEVMLRRMGMS